MDGTPLCGKTVGKSVSDFERIVERRSGQRLSGHWKGPKGTNARRSEGHCGQFATRRTPDGAMKNPAGRRSSGPRKSYT